MHASPGELRCRRTCALLLTIAAIVGASGCRPASDDAAAADTSSSAAATPVPFDSSTVTILDSLGARMVVSQCSRPGPAPVAGYWMPTREQVAAADAAVMRALAAGVMQSTGAQVDTGVRRYHRQYVGLVRGDARILYVNGMARERVVAHPDTNAWRTHAQVACDGGTGFFGAEYDPATRRVSALHFNGPG